MANEEHLKVLKEGVDTWNEWRANNHDINPDLSGANLNGINIAGAYLYQVNLVGADLRGAKMVDRERKLPFPSRMAYLARADLRNANLYGTSLWGCSLDGANLSGADLRDVILDEAKLALADLSGANLRDARLMQVDLQAANLSGADLRGANLIRAHLRVANLREANLSGAHLEEAVIVRADLTRANLSGCYVFGASVWQPTLDATIQTDLIISLQGEPIITLDNLEIAQFVYLLLHNDKIRDVIDTIGKKAVLILGRFTPDRKAVLDALRAELRKWSYVPILFDFDKPVSRDLTETVMILASLSRFVIADLSDPNSIPHELMSFARDLPSVPIKPIFCATKEHPKPYPMFEDYLGRFRHVMPIYRYKTLEGLIASLEEKVIKPAEKKVKVVRPKPLSR